MESDMGALIVTLKDRRGKKDGSASSLRKQSESS